MLPIKTEKTLTHSIVINLKAQAQDILDVIVKVNFFWESSEKNIGIINSLNPRQRHYM